MTTAAGARTRLRGALARHPIAPRVRVYETLRSAHLERAHVLPPATILYRDRRYDFDEQVAEGLDLVQAGPWRTAWLLLRSDVEELEINEPLMLSSLRRTLLAVAAVRLSGVLRRARGGRRGRTTVATYAIGNDDPFRPPVAGLLARARRLADRGGTRLLAAAVDRVVFGTPGAQALYDDVLPGLGATRFLLPALPAACSCGAAGPADGAGATILALGAYEERKGLPELLAAWPLVADAEPGVVLRVVGKGRLASEVDDAATRLPRVLVEHDPPRARIHELLGAADVVVLLSRRTARWREQVGLPLVEGLAHGCVVVTTAETGLAPWLAAHGHVVIEGDPTPVVVREALREAVARASRPGAREAVLASLPSEDGRLGADRLMFAPNPARTTPRVTRANG